MKRFLSIIVIIFLIVFGMGIYYINLDKNYDYVEEFYSFPIPKNAKLESENEISKNYRWETSKATGLPLSYRLMIKKSGWKAIGNEGTYINYKKDGKIISIGFWTDYIEIRDESELKP